MLRILHHLLPLCNPAGNTPNGEQHCEHGGWESQGPEHEARIEIYIGIQLPLHKIFIFKGNLLQSHGQVEQGVLNTRVPENLQEMVAQKWQPESGYAKQSAGVTNKITSIEIPCTIGCK